MRDAGDLPVSTVWCRKVERHQSCRSAGTGSSPAVPRAMGFGLIPTHAGLARYAHPEPRRTDQAFLLGEALLSAADRNSHQMRRMWAIRTLQSRRAPCGARRNARRTQQASTAATVCINRRGHRSRSAHRTCLQDMPLVDQDSKEYNPISEKCQELNY